MLFLIVLMILIFAGKMQISDDTAILILLLSMLEIILEVLGILSSIHVVN